MGVRGRRRRRCTRITIASQERTKAAITTTTAIAKISSRAPSALARSITEEETVGIITIEIRRCETSQASRAKSPINECTSAKLDSCRTEK